MEKYKPIASYTSPEDIIAMFPCDGLKPDMADIIYKQYTSGEGYPHKYNELDEEAYWDEDEIAGDRNFILTEDKKHGIRFTPGIMSKGIPYGYYIDIYEAFDDNHPASTPQVPDKSLAIRILNFVLPYIPDHIRDEALGMIYKA